ncbi:NADPH:quinone oxidoreductase [Bacillus sp. JCM 19046]|nr:NADPH:quinone oxidoreductase [Bacillus sp. JCM 19045]GAF18326.1 NADPH:quinone oxidoreductase [Bacillus sp. JCM 19046]
MNSNRSIAIICGSLRKDSYNRKLMNLISEKAPDHWTVAEIQIETLPFYNADIEAEGDPESVHNLKEAIGHADGVIVVTPEYNSGTPAVLKNALDWASRPVKTTVLKQKPFAIAGASPGGAGSAHSQNQVRQTLLTLDAYTMPGPKLLVSAVHQKLNDEQTALNDEGTVRRVEKFVTSFDAWINHFN